MKVRFANLTVLYGLFEDYGNCCKSSKNPDSPYRKMSYDNWRLVRDYFRSIPVKYFGLDAQINFYTEDKSMNIYVNDSGKVLTLTGEEGFFYYLLNHPKQVRPIGTEESNLEEKNEKEKDIMKGFNFDFGSCKNDNVKMSMYGIAVMNANGTFVSYNKETGDIIDVDILNFDAGSYLFKMPVAISNIKEGMTIIHNRVPMFVNSVDTESEKLVVTDPRAGEEKIIIPTKNMFGFNFVTQIVSMFDFCGAGAETATKDNPFGNMLPFLMMNNNGDIDPIALAMMSMGGGVNNNKMMPFALMAMSDKNKSIKDMLPFLMMGNCGMFNQSK